MEKKKVRVDGIPSDIPPERAKDKLFIHFLRARNGGGEIEQLEFLPGPPAYALITFEENKVAERILETRDHNLTVNGKIYVLAVSEVCDKLEPDKIFENLSLTVNYKRLPEHCKNIMRNLSTSHADLQCRLDENKKTCIVSGAYTKVQSLSMEILSMLGTGDINTEREPKQIESKTKSDLEKIISSAPLELRDTSQTTAEKYFQDSPYLEEDQKLYSGAEAPEQGEEPLVWDTDIYKYIQRLLREEYQHILKKHNVKVVDTSFDEITSLYLQSVTEDDRKRGDLFNARCELLSLYQELEFRLRKEQIGKILLKLDKDSMREVFRDIHTQWPGVFCQEDKKNIYFIGDGSDVAHAKNHVIKRYMFKSLPDLEMDLKQSHQKKDELAGLKTQSNTYKTPQSEDRLEAISNQPSSHTASSLSSYPYSQYKELPLSKKMLLQEPEKGKYQRPGLHVDLLKSHKNGRYGFRENESLQTDKNPGERSLKRSDVATTLKTNETKDVRKAGPVKPVPLQYSSLVDMDFSTSKLLETGTNKTGIRRSNSFSHLYSKEKCASDKQGSSPQTLPKAEIYVDNRLWTYLKDAYRSDIDRLCSGIILTEEEKKKIVILTLQADSRSTLFTAKENIQSFYEKKSNSIVYKNLTYSALQAKGPDDKALEDLRTAFEHCSDKIRIHADKDMVQLTYPEEIQSKAIEVYNLFIESRNTPPAPLSLSMVSLGSNEQNYESNLGIGQFTTNYTFSNIVPRTGLESQKNTSLGDFDLFSPKSNGSVPYYMTQKSLEGNIPSDAQMPSYTRTLPDCSNIGGFFEEPDPYKVKSSLPSTFQLDRGRTMEDKMEQIFDDFRTSLVINEQFNSEEQEKEREELSKKEAEKDNTTKNLIQKEDITLQEEKRIPANGQESIKKGKVCDLCKVSMTLVPCGHYQCNNCESPVQDKCHICSSAVPAQDSSGLKATMVYTQMSLSLQGYERNPTLKIIYDVPDGIQGAGHPHPGSPYKGGRFEAYVPDNHEGKKLLVLLEKALSQGLTFQIRNFESCDKVTWNYIPHKTSPDGGKAKNGYPDSSYIKTLMKLLQSYGIE
ncbi:uncharacterized protein LOC108701030 [Xenopus laevis]|uniref:RING-type E3 ubiquitin transferase n=2 Tax=Xenopus laevis TaxID=8355 RepID=A0A1L8ETT0_XENLA|nr:uncharacterized protein LOC108701030 [Xenopus laevis]OCT62752.1 hypothetical protein XELAEV_18043843mg [Xenopus laevis]